MIVERLSIEPSRRCSKGCAFCYNGSTAEGSGLWSAAALGALVTDCAAHGVRAVSLGGGEPLEWPEIFTVLEALRGTVFRSLTTNGRPLLQREVYERLLRAQPDKVHVSIHAPENLREVAQVVSWVQALAADGLRSGVNLLVRRSRLAEAAHAARLLHAAGIDNRRIVFLPLRAPGGADTPTPAEVAAVAGAPFHPFQSMSCLRGCAKSPRFVSIAADWTVAWCSYTTARAPLRAPTYTALCEALVDLPLRSCTEALVRMSHRPLREQAV